MVVCDWLGSIYGLWICRKGKGMFEAKWVWAWGELNHKQIRNFGGSSCVHVGWCAYAFIVEFRETLINESPKT